MLIAICAVSAGVIGCGGNNSALYTPIPTGNQNVTVTISGTTPITFTGTTTSGSASVGSVSSMLDVAVGETITGTGIPTGTTIASIGSGNSFTLSANATSGATETLTATLPVSRTYTIPIDVF
jgi:hypothetical protein